MQRQMSQNPQQNPKNYKPSAVGKKSCPNPPSNEPLTGIQHPLRVHSAEILLTSGRIAYLPTFHIATEFVAHVTSTCMKKHIFENSEHHIGRPFGIEGKKKHFRFFSSLW
jgi:hypothetical protein